MRIALIGHGKMGKELEKAALSKQHEIVLVVTSANADDINKLNASHADVAIEFSTPGAVMHNINKCFDAHVPVVVGTTGWYDKIPEVREKCTKEGHSLIYASNFSIGVNILFELNRMLAKIMNNQPAYDVSIEEIHHTQKLDSPSGTGITIAKDILERIERKNKWVDIAPGAKQENNISPNDLLIHSKRIGEVVGTHIITYASAIDKLELKHEAHSRVGFVQGALVAAEWISGKKGFYTMQDLLQSEIK